MSQQTTDLDTARAPYPVREIHDIPYRTGESLSEYERDRCRLDLYLPESTADFPCLVWFHGGGMIEGDKRGGATPEICRTLAGEGIAVAAANYRLSPLVRYPAYIEDAAAAFAWAVGHIGEYGGAAGRIFVGGHSAGAYLAYMVAMDPRYLAAHGVGGDRIAGVLPISGQTVTHHTVRDERGLPRTRIVVDDAAPLHHARADTPPILAFYADADMDCRGDENRYFAAALRAAGNARVQCREIAGRDHGSVADRIVEPGDPVRLALVDFMKST